MASPPATNGDGKGWIPAGLKTVVVAWAVIGLNKPWTNPKPSLPFPFTLKDPSLSFLSSVSKAVTQRGVQTFKLPSNKVSFTIFNKTTPKPQPEVQS